MILQPWCSLTVRRTLKQQLLHQRQRPLGSLSWLTSLLQRHSQTFVPRCQTPSSLSSIRSYHEVSFLNTGEPKDVLQYHSDTTVDDIVPPPSSTSTSTTTTTAAPLCRVEMLHVPWNPADVNTVQGRYPSPHKNSNKKNNNDNHSRYFPSQTVVGSEGWGRVTHVLQTDDDKNCLTNDIPNWISEGSLVTLGASGYGTMRSSLWVPWHDLLTVPEQLLDRTGPAGCTLFQLGGTALRLLTDFVNLQRGDVILQNAGNSGVGMLVSQLAQALFGVSAVSMVRRGSKTVQELDQLIDYMMTVGKNALVVVEEDLIDDKEAMHTFQQQLLDLSQNHQLPKLALNSVGGPSAQLLLKVLESGGSMVTYGGMSGQGIQVGTPQLIFKDVRVVGYWHSRWMIRHDISEKQDMIDTLAKAVLDDQLTLPPVEVFSLRNVHKGLQWQSEQSQAVIRSKLVWDCQE
ncbi:alcohol dehydrogenase [Nitzschia inconspicua]|uniref:Alcohol dehydrogenase n=1 Tax=Nitzschia inconspicua TaxID=303405 RepID=A0A9K3KTU5_9STRA|nr:alcohol dehydrogenase [Nitzschia inconspicua]